MAAFSSKGQIFPYGTSYGMFPDPATQQADVYKKTAPSFADSPFVNQFLGTATPRPQMGPPSPQMGPPRPTTTPMAKDKSNLAYMLIALGGALRGDKNFIQNTMAIKQSQTEKERREAQKKRYEEALASAEPGSSTYNLIKGLGPEGIVQSTIESFRLEGAKTKAQSDLLVKLAEEGRAEVRTLEKEERAVGRTLAQEEREFERATKESIQEKILEEKERIKNINLYKSAGLSEEEATLLASGVSGGDIEKLLGDDKSGQQLINQVKEETQKVAEKTSYQDAYANLQQAFGPVDATKEATNIATRFAFGKDFFPETGGASRAQQALNLDVLAILANDYTGRPSNLLLTEIKNILPTSRATSHKDAYEKYLNILNRTKERIRNIENGIKSGVASEAQIDKYREELFKSYGLQKKLEAAVLSLEGAPVETLKPDDSAIRRDYSSLFIEE